MAPRLLLQQLLEDICPNVYFQPPASLTMQYPAIVYRRDPADTKHANNLPYRITQQYEVTLIARDPDSNLRDKLAALPTSQHARFFVADNLNHDVFSIYF